MLGLVALGLFAIAVFTWDSSSTTSGADSPQSKIQRAVDDMNTQLDKQNAVLVKISDNLGNVVKTVMALSGHVEKVQVALENGSARPATSPQNPKEPPHQRRTEGDLTANDWLVIQTNLAALGHALGKPDGFAGPSTRKAIRAYQAAIHANPDGKLTAEQIERLVRPRS
jgi:hypothetical protein